MGAHVDPVHWDKSIQAVGGSFLQSYAWGEFQQAYGRSVERWQTDGLALQSIVYRLPAGRTYLFSPYGPVGTPTIDTTIALLDQIERWSEKHQAIFWRYEQGGEHYGGRRVTSVHPVTTWLTTLQEPGVMLAQMKPKWRYNIHLAERKGVVIRRSRAVVDVDQFYAVLAQTAERQKIRLHPKSYYQLMVEKLGHTDEVTLYFAEHNQQVLAAALVIRFGNTLTYLHGGSDYAQRQFMAPHLLHWSMMQEAYRAGCTIYDWFGIADTDASTHPWAALTRFKQGFGGRRQSYAGTFELPLQRTWYNAYRLIRKSRTWISL